MLENCIARICNLPKDFKNSGSKSVVDLIEESNFRRYQEEIQIRDIRNYLQNNLDLLDWWQIWSYDKRVSSGFFLELNIGNLWKRSVVSILYSNGKSKNLNKYFRPIDACSEYILLECSAILEH